MVESPRVDLPPSAALLPNAEQRPAAELRSVQWLHPLSLGFEFAAGIRKQLFPAIIALFSASTGSIVGGWIAFLFFFLSMGFAVFRYLTLRFELRTDELVIDEGLIFKRHRTIPIERIQNIDLLQNPFHRMFKVAEVRVETASGTEPEATLRVLSIAEFESLRSRVFANKEKLKSSRGLSTDVAQTRSDASLEVGSVDPNSSQHIAAEVETAIEAEPQLVATIPLKNLVLAGLASNRGTVLLFVGLGILWEMQFTTRFGSNGKFDIGIDFGWEDFVSTLGRSIHTSAWILVLIAAIPVLMLLLKLVSIIWHVLRFYDYRLERVGEDLRVRCGLFTRVSATIRRDRIQLISVQRTLLARLLGIASIRIETAGGGAGQEDPASSMARKWFLPVIGEGDVSRIVSELRPGLQWDEATFPWKPLSNRACSRLRRVSILVSLIILAVSGYFVFWTGLVLGLLFATFGWWWAKRKALSMRYARTEQGVLYRNGFLSRKCSIAFLDKVQSVKIAHSPFDRRWRMATLSVDTIAAGAAEHTICVPMLDADFAQKERDSIAQLASMATAI